MAPSVAVKRAPCVQRAADSPPKPPRPSTREEALEEARTRLDPRVAAGLFLKGGDHATIVLRDAHRLYERFVTLPAAADAGPAALATAASASAASASAAADAAAAAASAATFGGRYWGAYFLKLQVTCCCCCC